MNNVAPNCSCAKLTRLEGAAAHAYSTQFLHKENKEIEILSCRECGIKWQRVEEAKRPSLIKIGE